jgi:hypothetical protein
MRRLGNAHFIGDLTMPARANPSCGDKTLDRNQ